MIHKTASPSHHHTGGPVERANQTLKNKLKRIIVFGKYQ